MGTSDGYLARVFSVPEAPLRVIKLRYTTELLIFLPYSIGAHIRRRTGTIVPALTDVAVSSRMLLRSLVPIPSSCTRQQSYGLPCLTFTVLLHCWTQRTPIGAPRILILLWYVCMVTFPIRHNSSRGRQNSHLPRLIFSPTDSLSSSAIAVTR